MTIDLNITQLAAAIQRSLSEDDGKDAGKGLSVNRKVENGIATWDVFLGVAPTSMTVLDSQTDYRSMQPADIATVIISEWDAEWDD